MRFLQFYAGATVCAPSRSVLAGADVPKDLDSLSFLPTLIGRPDQQKKHEFLYWEFHERAFSQAALYQGRWKGIRSQRSDAPIELHDLHNDIGELTDVANEHPEIVDSIDQYLRTARSPSETWPARWANE